MRDLRFSVLMFLPLPRAGVAWPISVFVGVVGRYPICVISQPIMVYLLEASDLVEPGPEPEHQKTLMNARLYCDYVSQAARTRFQSPRDRGSEGEKAAFPIGKSEHIANKWLQSSGTTKKLDSDEIT